MQDELLDHMQRNLYSKSNDQIKINQFPNGENEKGIEEVLQSSRNCRKRMQNEKLRNQNGHNLLPEPDYKMDIYNITKQVAATDSFLRCKLSALVIYFRICHQQSEPNGAVD
ncbi:unnamed protein product [Sphenostylis stenocarpa]|uniref:Uncharacterized protein n=1 Tax=Sphenostylis stenocarpa TaxID=92480 RepID=A0AA86TPB6_9FABA|nr:unnamed protein product [Sphenostylis stenocarpa]